MLLSFLLNNDAQSCHIKRLNLSSKGTDPLIRVCNKGWRVYELIISYSRAQAKEDYSLIDVSVIAKKAGFLYPVVMTRNLWDGYIEPAPELQHQDATERLLDTLTMLLSTIKSTKNPGSCIWFTVSFQMHIDGKHTIQDVELKSTLSPGGDAVPMITIMLPDEA